METTHCHIVVSISSCALWKLLTATLWFLSHIAHCENCSLPRRGFYHLLHCGNCSLPRRGFCFARHLSRFDEIKLQIIGFPVIVIESLSSALSAYAVVSFRCCWLPLLSASLLSVSLLAASVAVRFVAAVSMSATFSV